MAINCVAEQHDESMEFCNFVAGRLRLQLIKDIDPKWGTLLETHLYPDVYQDKCTIPLRHQVKTQFR